MATSKISVTEGSGKNLATNSFTEDAVTKEVSRVTINEADGSDTAMAAKLGALTETAPASDTASSGLNGRLQRIAQRLTSMMADGGLTTIGAKADAANAATDTTAITAMSVWKQISAYLKTLSDNVVSLGRHTQPLSTPVVLASFEYETVAVSQTDQIMGATGAVGDYLEGVLCVVGTAATSEVKIKDGNGTAITILNNNVGAGIGTYYIPIGLLCANATTPGWKITTAAGVTAIGVGKFT